MAIFEQGHALVVGVGEYQDNRYSVPITRNDAQGVYEVLRNPQICGYPPDQVEFLHDQAATREGILTALGNLAQRARNQDTAFIFLAGHGAPAENGEWHFATHDTQFESIRSLQGGNALAQKTFLDALRQVRAQKILVLINACFSGLVAPGLGPQPPAPAPVGAPPPEELSNAVLGTGEGRVIITASRGNQESLFDMGASRTFFGDAVVQGLNGNGVSNKNGYIGLFELYEFIYQRAMAGASKYQRAQEPVLTVLQGIGPFPVALYKGSTPGNLADAGFMPTPPPNTAANVVQIGAGARVATITGSNNTVTQNTRTENTSGDRNTVNIGAGARVGQAAAGRNIQQVLSQNPTPPELADLFQAIYQKIDARPDDPNVGREEIKGWVRNIEAEVANGDNANPNKLERNLKYLKDNAPEILEATTAALLNPVAGVARAIAVVAKRVRDAA